MKRRITKVVLFLLLGAVINVAVAWGITLRLDQDSMGLYGIVDSYDEPSWNLVYGRATGVVYISSYPVSTDERSEYRNYKEEYGETLEEYYRRVWPNHAALPSLPRWSRPSKTLSVAEIASTPAQIERAQGWPFLALRMKSTYRSVDGTRPYDRWWFGINLETDDNTSADWDHSRVLALYPIASGFSINTVLYALLLWLLTLGPLTVRRMIRRKCGHCIKCGYDLRASSGGGCPECGWRREDVS